MHLRQLRRLRALMPPGIIRIGTRGSRLALWQAEWVQAAIRRRNPALAVELVKIKTRGDRILDRPLARVGGKGLFVKEIEDALLRKAIDVAVHSFKDMPADMPAGLCIGPIPQRENPLDALISASGRPLARLVENARIGTSSLRRAAQLRALRSDLRILPLRGNVDTRIRKLDEGEVDALVLAAAGLKRLDLADRITEYLPASSLLPAVAQGALCIQLRSGDERTLAAVAGLNHPETESVVRGERAFLKRLGGDCQVPLAAHGTITDGRLILQGLVAEPDGSVILRDALAGPAAESEKIGRSLAERLLAQGAGTIMAKLKANEHESPQG